MPDFQPTPEQQAIVEAAYGRRESLMIRAFAGCSKTTTLELIARAMPSATPILYIVFNVKNKKEAEGRFPSNVTVKTINGLGHAAWGRAIGKRLIVDDRKLGKLVTAEFKERRFDATTDQWNTVRELVTKAMQAGLVPAAFATTARGLVPDDPAVWSELASDAGLFDCTEVLVDVAKSVLAASIRLAFDGTISFDDQIYMSVVFHGNFPRFPVIMVDEAQDQSVLNIEMIKRCAADRLIVVGDEKQACYVWRGAAGDAMARLRALRPQWIDLPLATTFRCPKVVVARNAAHAQGFTAFHANSEGEHIRLPRQGADNWTWSDLPAEGTVAAICRNNAPVLSLAFKLLARGVSVVMLGRDIGKGLVTLSKKLMPLDDIPASACVQLIEDWREKEATLAAANGSDRKAESVHDRADCLLAVLSGSSTDACRNSGDLRARLEALFARDTGRVTLSSIHRAKGLEWHTVVHLDPWRIPSKYAKRPVEQEQERNLRYIAETRAKHTLVEASMEDFA